MTNNIITLKDIKKTIAKTTRQQENKIKIEELTGKTNLIFQATFTNYTPFMPGDYDTTTFKHCPQNNNEKCEVNVIPLAQQIIGKMRWLLRVALASLPECREYQTYKDIEEKCLTIKIKEGNHVKDIPIMDLLFGTIRRNSENKKSRSALYRLLVLYKHLHANPWNPVRKVYSDFYRKIRSFNRGNLIDRYSALLKRNPNDTIRLLSRPINTNEIEIEVRVYENKSLYENIYVTDTITIEWLRKLYIVLLISVITILGIGKGANRGFGRFILSKSIKTSERIQNLLESFSKGNESSIKHILIHIMEIVDLNRTLHNQHQASREIVDTVSRIPRLHMAVSGMKAYAFTYRNNRNSELAIIDAIEVAAASVLKQCIKRRTGASTGGHIHTWIYGLPRKSKMRCVCGKGEVGEQYYGYIVTDLEALMEISQTNGNLASFCLPSRNCCGGHNVGNDVDSIEDIEDKFESKLGELRRQSMIIIFPIPQSSRSDRKVKVSVIPFLTNDMEFAIYQPNDEKRRYLQTYGDLVLYHISGKMQFTNYGNKLPCCNVHLVSIGKLLRSDSVSPGDGDTIDLVPIQCKCRSETNCVSMKGNGYDNVSYADVMNTAFSYIDDCLTRYFRFNSLELR